MIYSHLSIRECDDLRPTEEPIADRRPPRPQPLLPEWRYSATETPAGYRSPGDDFYCLRFAVWYNSADCAIRTRDRTCGGCLNCDQGRFNLKRHAAALRQRVIARRFG